MTMKQDWRSWINHAKFHSLPWCAFSKCIRSDSRSLSTSQLLLPTKTCQMSAWCLMLYFASNGNIELDSLMRVLLLLGSKKGYWLSLKIPALELGHQGHVSPRGQPGLERLHIRFCQRKFSWTFCVIPLQNQVPMVNWAIFMIWRRIICLRDERLYSFYTPTHTEAHTQFALKTSLASTCVQYSGIII